MDKINFKCECGKAVTVDAKHAGKRGHCPACGLLITIPLAPAAEPSAPFWPPGSPGDAPIEPAAGGREFAGVTSAELPERMRANRSVAGRRCTICQTAIAVGEDVHNCARCKSSYHEECWNQNGGCGTYGCENGPGASSASPLQRPFYHDGPLGSGAIAPSAAPARPPNVPHSTASFSTGYAPYVGTSSGKATASLVLGIIGLIFAGVILGIIAICLAQSAKRQIGQHPGMSGSGMATAGLVLGIIDVVFGAIICLGLLSGV